MLDSESTKSLVAAKFSDVLGTYMALGFDRLCVSKGFPTKGFASDISSSVK